jgi:hypothetical protein
MKISQKVLATHKPLKLEQPQGLNAPSSLPVRKTVRTSAWFLFGDLL